LRVRWTSRALRDLKAIGAFIAKDNPAAARRWVARLKERARKAAPIPQAGRKVPEIERDDVREVFLGSYRIMYRIYPGVIEVLTVLEAHRLFSEDLRPQELGGGE
jgi:toxin ParE1/3/4